MTDERRPNEDARRRDGERKPFVKRDGDRKPYEKREGERKPFVKRDGDRKPYAARDGERKPYVKRDGDRPYPPRDGERKPYAPRDGERKSYPPRDGERRPYTPRDGERKSYPPRDGERKSYPPRDGERRPYTPRDGERKSYPPRDGERKSYPPRDGERKSYPPRDGERKSYPPRDGERKSYPPRDGERKSYPPRDGERKSYPPRDGERKSYPPRDGDRKPYTPRDGGDRKPYAKRDGGGRPFEDRGDDRRASRPPQEQRESGPWIPPEVTAKDLHPSARNELKTLSKENAEQVGRHLAMAALLIDEDPQLAHEHALAATRRAGRIAVARETAAITAYAIGDYALALRELRTYRRISGRDDQIALMVDSERGVGRPDRALEVGRSVDRSALPTPARAELAIAMSGAQLDLGEPERALTELDIPELDPDRAFEWSPALFAARATVLEELGRDDEAAQWRHRAEVAAEAIDAALGMTGDDEFQVVDEVEEIAIDIEDDIDEDDIDETPSDEVPAEDEEAPSDEAAVDEAPDEDGDVEGEAAVEPEPASTEADADAHAADALTAPDEDAQK
ncbi:primosomal protein [Microbacterium sp. NPDC058021]|uniref:primosomal protein n=1 Tax=Microbacterium sp. NPDC058021 TaxID=3346306 RepID=UPI0036DACC63